MHTDQMNKCLGSELSAVETYNQALDKEHNASDGADFQQLASILNDHQQAASQIEAQIQSVGGTPVHDSGAWGTWSKMLMGTAKLLGYRAALKALKEGEESGLKEYRDLLSDKAAPRQATGLFDSLMAKQQTHIRTLDNLMARLCAVQDADVRASPFAGESAERPLTRHFFDQALKLWRCLTQQELGLATFWGSVHGCCDGVESMRNRGDPPISAR